MVRVYGRFQRSMEFRTPRYAKKFRIMFTVLFSCFNHKSTLSSFKTLITGISKPGPKPFLTSSAEQDLVKWIIEGQAIGDPKSRRDIRDAAWLLSEESVDCAKFGPEGPTDGFVQRFLQRNNRLTVRKPEALSSASANVTPQNLITWFQHIYRYFEENNLLDVLDDPKRVCNCDEAGFLVNPMGNLVVAERNSKDVHKVLKNEKEQITALYTFSGDGFSYNPFVVFPGKRLNLEVKSNIPPGIDYTMTESGWMNTTAFGEFLKVFASQARARGVCFPIALFLDGHKSHEGMDIAKIARQEGIVLVRLYPNATAYYQPADKGIFKPLKTLYQKYVRFNEVFDGLTPHKKNFAKILSRIHKEIDPQWVKTSFKVCGLYPFNPNSIDFARLKADGNDTLTGIEELNVCTVGDAANVDLTPPDAETTVELVLQNFELVNNLDMMVNQCEKTSLPNVCTVINDNSCSIDIKSETFVTTSDESHGSTINTNQLGPNLSDPDITNDEIPTIDTILNINENACSMDSQSAFRKKKEFYAIDSPFSIFCQTVGKEKVEKYEDSNFLTEHENEKLLFLTYLQLKEHEVKRLSPLTLPLHKKPAKRGRVTKDKLHFVTTSEEYERAMDKKKNDKAEKEAEKQQRKELREANQIKKKEAGTKKQKVQRKKTIGKEN